MGTQKNSTITATRLCPDLCNNDDDAVYLVPSWAHQHHQRLDYCCNNSKPAFYGSSPEQLQPHKHYPSAYLSLLDLLLWRNYKEGLWFLHLLIGNSRVQCSGPKTSRCGYLRDWRSPSVPFKIWPSVFPSEHSISRDPPQKE